MVKKDLDAFKNGRSGLTQAEQGDAVAAADAQNQSAASALMMQSGQQGMAGTGAGKAMNADAIKASQESIRGARADVTDLNQRIVAQRKQDIMDQLSREEAYRQKRADRALAVTQAVAPMVGRLAEKAIPGIGKLLG